MLNIVRMTEHEELNDECFEEDHDHQVDQIHSRSFDYKTQTSNTEDDVVAWIIMELVYLL